MPDARNVLVAPMFADGRAVGAIVVEHRARRRTGVERRTAAMLGQFASVAALNLRNAVLLQHVQDLAERDSLTGAANRRMFQLALERILHGAPVERRPDQVTAVLFLDLDDFKVVNDTLGHAAGDALLVAVTERISGLVRDGDLVARLGGDEFAVLIEDEPDAQPRPVDGRPARLRAARAVRLRRQARRGDAPRSASPAPATRSPVRADLVRNADVAMYMAKANGKSGFAVFDPGMHEAMRERHELSVDLQRAVDLDQLGLLYQPIVDARTRQAGRRRGARPLVPPDARPDHARPLHRDRRGDRHDPADRPLGPPPGMRRGRPMARGRERPVRTFVSVNVSAREIQQLGFVDAVKAVLGESGLDPNRLVLEITETALLKATPTTVATLQASGRSASGPSSTTSGPATSRSATSASSRSTPSRSRTSSCRTPTRPRSRRRSPARSWPWAGRSASRRSPRGSRPPSRPTGCATSAALFGQGYAFARPMPEAQLLGRLRDRLDGPGRRRGHHIRPARGERPGRQRLTPAGHAEAGDRGQASRSSPGSGAPPRELVVDVLH